MHGPSPLPLFIELGVAILLGGGWLLRHRIAGAARGALAVLRRQPRPASARPPAVERAPGA
jgi:hypothetical protein